MRGEAEADCGVLEGVVLRAPSCPEAGLRITITRSGNNIIQEATAPLIIEN